MSFDYYMKFVGGGIDAKTLLERVLGFAPSERTEISETAPGAFGTDDVAFYAASRPLDAEGRALVRKLIGVKVDSAIRFRPYNENFNENARKAFAIAVATMKAFPGDFLFAADGADFILLRRGAKTFLNVHPDVWGANGPVDIDVPHVKVSHVINSPLP